MAADKPTPLPKRTKKARITEDQYASMKATANGLVPMLAFNFRREEEYPTKTALRDRIDFIKTAADVISKAADLLVSELRDLRVLDLLEDGKQIEDLNPAYQGLSDISAGAAREGLREISARAANLLERIPRTQGQGRLYPSVAEGPDARELCALIVNVVWHEECGKWPGKGNAKAQELCEHLWHAAGGTHPGSGWGRPGGGAAWRKILAKAKRFRPPQIAGMRILQMLMPTEPRRPLAPGRLAALLYDHPTSRSRALGQPNGGIEKAE